jgi:sec-independent protein translocase protein TatA
MSMPGIGELLVIFLIILIVFGAGKIPSIAKDLGSAFSEFRKAMQGNGDDEEKPAKTETKKKKK